MTSSQIEYIQLSTSAIADVLTGNIATFTNRTIATPPIDFRNLQKRDFKVYLNNRRIPDLYVDYVNQVGSNIDVLVNVAEFLDIPNAIFEEDDEVMLIGKFS